MESQIKYYVDDAKKAKTEARDENKEMARDYIANFHLTNEYQYFRAYWRNFAYAKILGRVEKL